ncbi:MAG: hypothetical protein QM783_19260 [Phycisphaerales bacterium]
MTRTPVIVLSVLMSAAAAQADLLNNGFENNTFAASGASQFNLSNAQLTAAVSGVTGFGSASEVDLVTFPGFHGGAPIDGNWMLGLHAQSGGSVTDGVALHLVLPVVVGEVYHMSMNGFQGSPDSPAEIQIGFSNDPTQFGSFFASFTPNAQWGWTTFQADFLALDGGSYMTIRVVGNESYALIDSLVLTPTPGAAAALGLAGAASLRRRRR